MELISDNSKRNEFVEKVASFIVALIICSKLTNASIASINTGSISTGIINMGLIWGGLLFYYIVGKVRRANRLGFYFIIYVLLFFGVSNLVLSGHVNELTVHFLEYGLLGYLIAGTDFDFEKATRYTAYIVILLSVPTYHMIQESFLIYDDSILGMNESYTLLPPVIAIFVHFLYFRKKRDWIMYIAYILSVFVMGLLLLRGTRGAVLCLFALVLFALLNISKLRGKLSLGKLIFIAILFIAIINFDSIIEVLVQSLSQNGIHIRFLEKTAKLGLSSSNDLSNGRMSLYTMAINDFARSPIWGNGIGYFPNVHGINYPHNLVFQVFSEGGILLGVPIVCMVWTSLYYLISGKIQNENYRIAVIALASCTIPAAFVSGELWTYQLLWLLFGILIKKRRMLTNAIIDEK